MNRTETKIKLALILACIAAVVGQGVSSSKSAAGAPAKEEPRIQRQGEFAGLPSPPGPHIEKIKALGDDTWLNLGAPAADPKWGRALGRSWSPKMPFAPDLRGAFLAGEGGHGWVNPKTRRQMDDCWFYDINAHRWLCVYPGADTANPEFKINADGFTTIKDGEPIPVTMLVHAYECVTYDADLKRFMCMAQSCAYGPAGEWNKRCKGPGSPWYFDTVSGKWGRQPLKGTYPSNTGLGDVLMYVPSRKQAFYHAFGSGRNHSYYYDPATNQWAEVKTAWTEGNRPKDLEFKPPSGGDAVACYDSKRDRIYMGRDNKLWFFDVQAAAWVDPKPKGEFTCHATHDTVLNYDAANDKVVAINIGEGRGSDGRKVCTYDADTNTAAATAGSVPKDIPQMNGFYDPALNVHFIHAAIDNREGVIWAYRLKKAAANR